mmetsp:Transcript_97890/g.276925  ORF Transcript_97890/g.276925 Transcript_97890/m.276925 type:complete len:350 (+) Transcript_97890:198-1247(+)
MDCIFCCAKDNRTQVAAENTQVVPAKQVEDDDAPGFMSAVAVEELTADPEQISEVGPIVETCVCSASPQALQSNAPVPVLRRKVSGVSCDSGRSAPDNNFRHLRRAGTGASTGFGNDSDTSSSGRAGAAKGILRRQASASSTCQGGPFGGDLFISETPTSSIFENPEEYRISFSGEQLRTMRQGDLGLELDASDGVSLLVLKVSDGPAKEWNATSPKAVRVRRCDRIMEVNGVAGDSFRLLDMIKTEKDLLMLQLRRAKEFKINIVKGEAGVESPIGVDVVHSGEETICVKRVKEGLINDWNIKNPDRRVEAGDRIVQVNGKRHDSREMLNVVQQSPVLEMVISRTPIY